MLWHSMGLFIKGSGRIQKSRNLEFLGRGKNPLKLKLATLTLAGPLLILPLTKLIESPLIKPVYTRLVLRARY